MKVGGFITYHGPLGQKSVKLVEYFEVKKCSRTSLLTMTELFLSNFAIQGSPARQNTLSTIASQ